MDSIRVTTTLDADNIGWKGSQLRCLLLTSLETSALQKSLKRIINQKDVDGLVIEFANDFKYYPQGFTDWREIEIDKEKIPINGSIDYCEKLNSWWLERSARTPVWDFACTAEINGKQGFILVEAKAHMNELLKEQDKSGARMGSPNRRKIVEALSHIEREYNYKLSADNHYQLSNRLAWSLKLASLGIPVVLIYLGCIKTEEMTVSKKDSLFEDSKQWDDVVTQYSEEINFRDWGKMISGEKLQDITCSVAPGFVYPIIRTANIQLQKGALNLTCNIDL